MIAVKHVQHLMQTKLCMLNRQLRPWCVQHSLCNIMSAMGSRSFGEWGANKPLVPCMLNRQALHNALRKLPGGMLLLLWQWIPPMWKSHVGTCCCSVPNPKDLWNGCCGSETVQTCEKTWAACCVLDLCC